MQNEAPPYSVVRRAKGWDVLLTPPGYDVPIEIIGFKSERAALEWAYRDARDWLMRHRVAA